MTASITDFVLISRPADCIRGIFLMISAVKGSMMFSGVGGFGS